MRVKFLCYFPWHFHSSFIPKFTFCTLFLLFPPTFCSCEVPEMSNHRQTSSPPSSFMTTRFQLQRFLTQRILKPKPKPFKFHYSCYSSSSNSTLKQDSVSANDFDFKPVTGFNKLLVKLNLLTVDSSERVPHGSVLKIILRGQVFPSP